MKDNAPVGHTCPTIDKAISFIKDAVNYLDEEHLTYGEGLLLKAIDYIEEVRSANATLRDWGNE